MESDLTHIEDQESALKLVDLNAGSAEFGADLAPLPYSLRVLLENALRRKDRQSADRIVHRKVGEPVSFLPARILLQDLLGVPVMVDLSSMRDAAKAHGTAPEHINPRLPVDLVIDHSLIPVHFGAHGAREKNEAIELEMNRERYRFLHWCQSSFSNVRIIPPGKGIMHQINIEFLARGYQIDDASGVAYPDTVYGTDSHTPMVNGIGVVGWGVGGLEAEMAMLGRETSFPVPEVVGIKLVGARNPGITATDLVLTITERLRQLGVVGKFVEFCGDSLDELPAADRCTISNMAPEYGATCVYFPIDRQTIDYLSLSGRDADHVAFVEALRQPEALDHLRDSVELRVGVRELQDRPSEAFYHAVGRASRDAGSTGAWWRRKVSIPAPALVAVAASLAALLLWIGPFGRTAEPTHRPPEPDRVVHFEPGVDWTYDRADTEARERRNDDDKTAAAVVDADEPAVVARDSGDADHRRDREAGG